MNFQNKEPRVIVSNGHSKFILAPLASELAQRGTLAQFITGAYPIGVGRFLAESVFSSLPSARRYISRYEDGIPSDKIKQQIISELLYQFSEIYKKKGGNMKFFYKLQLLSMRIYSAGALQCIKNSKAGIYHYRSGYGNHSVSYARKRGMSTICDHSIINPRILDTIINENGNWPQKLPKHINEFQALVYSDLQKADYLLVNSDFVKESFVRYGWDSDKIYVKYTGIDNDFLQFVGKNISHGKTARVMFAGEFSKRKGAEILVNALKRVRKENVEVELIGNIPAEMRDAAQSILINKNVKLVGYLSRRELAKKMCSCDIFVFPSLAEGSARVVFMAMACGCYIITTANSGSIVENGENGLIVEAGSPVALQDAINYAVGNLTMIRKIGKMNSTLIRENYTQKNYGTEVSRVYDEILNMR